MRSALVPLREHVIRTRSIGNARVDGVVGKQESPDYIVTFESGRKIGVEVAALTDGLNTASLSD